VAAGGRLRRPGLCGGADQRAAAGACLGMCRPAVVWMPPPPTTPNARLPLASQVWNLGAGGAQHTLTGHTVRAWALRTAPA
jgi:hypothetical protein